MFRTTADFLGCWTYETEATLKVFKTLTGSSLSQSVTVEHRTLARLAWHITLSLGEMMGRTGLAIAGPSHDAATPAGAEEIVSAYETAAHSTVDEVRKHWNDETLLVKDDMYGEQWARGYTLMALVLHQTHHRGQMTVLMRQAGLKVPGVYGPSLEEGNAFGMPAPLV